MEKGRISGGQLISIMFWAIMGTAVISLPVLIGMHAPRDAWMAAVIFIIGGVGLCFIIGSLAKMFPQKDFVHYVEEVFGLWIGRLLVTIFLLWLFHTTSFVLYQSTSFTKLTLLPRTPFIVGLIITVLPIIYLLYMGLESLARCGQVIFMITFSIFIFLFILHIPDANIENLLPFFDDGIPNILRSSLAPLAWAGEIMFVLFLVPYVKKDTNIGYYSGVTILLIGLGGVINEVFYTMIFGPLRQYLVNPFYSIIRYIRPTAFIERYDILFVAISLAGKFIKLGVFIYIFVFCLAQLLRMKDYRPLILPSTIGMVILANVSVASSTQLIHFLDTVFPFYTLPILYGFPLLTLIVAKVKKRFSDQVNM